MAGSANFLQIDRGLIEALLIKTTNANIVPDGTWFESICKFVYEKLKNEDVFLAQFYQSAAYKKLLLELEFCRTDAGCETAGLLEFETSSGDSNSADTPFEEEDEDELTWNSDEEATTTTTTTKATINHPLLDVSPAATSFKHSRSHSDCTGIFSDPLRAPAMSVVSAARSEHPPRAHSPLPFSSSSSHNHPRQLPARIFARIINTAILCDGQYAVYAIEVSVMVDAADGGSEQPQQQPSSTIGVVNAVKSWHVYRRYSKFLELKKALVKRSAAVARIPFPAKKTFQNTDRSVLEHRMVVLNEFLRLVCQRAEDNPDIYAVVRDFMEPDTNDRKMHGGAVVKTVRVFCACHLCLSRQSL